MKKHPIFLILVLFSLSIGSCKYDYILPEEVGPISDVKFSTQVAPIFSTEDKCTSCHKAGATSPDLTAANAFAEISGLINTTTPEESIIYAYPSPNTNTHTRKKYTAVEAATILQWIKEGAKNN
jgi:hypothetical protein